MRVATRTQLGILRVELGHGGTHRCFGLGTGEGLERRFSRIIVRSFVSDWSNSTQAFLLISGVTHSIFFFSCGPWLIHSELRLQHTRAD